jgi:hypothetical protein
MSVIQRCWKSMILAAECVASMRVVLREAAKWLCLTRMWHKCFRIQNQSTEHYVLWLASFKINLRRFILKCFPPNGWHNISFNPTGLSVHFTENLPHDADVSRPVNSGVMSPLHIEIKEVSHRSSVV